MISGFVWVSAQKDSIYVEAKLSADRKTVIVNQEIKYFNKTENPQNEIRLLNWISAYKPQNTPLANRKLEDQNRELYFAKPEELGRIENLKISGTDISDLEKENIYYHLPKTLNVGESTKLQLQYVLHLPDARFTKYGTSEKNISLKYFFPVPDSFENLDPSEKHYKDVEETANHSTFWTVNLD